MEPIPEEKTEGMPKEATPSEKPEDTSKKVEATPSEKSPGPEPPSLEKINAQFDELRLSIPREITAMEPWTTETQNRRYLRVHCVGQHESVTARYIKFFAASSETDDDQYNNILMFRLDRDGKWAYGLRHVYRPAE